MTVAITLAVGFGGCSSDSKATTTTTATTSVTADSGTGASATGTVDISVTVGVDSAPDRTEQIPLGATVHLTITDPNAAQEYHVHGYELGDGVEMDPGKTETFDFTADKAGEFEVESHATETVLVILKVG